MLRWFRRKAEKKRPPRPPAQAAPSTPSPPAAAGPPASDHPFAPFARVLGIAVPPPPPEEGSEDPDELLLAERILEHFRKNRPGPASAPSLSLRVLNLVASSDADVSEMVRLISSDAALSAGVLTVANSAHYRGVQEVETVRAAIVRLGLQEVARVAGALSAKSLFNPKVKAELAAHRERFAALYRRSLTVAYGAAFAALQQRGGREDRAFLGGMLHDVGRAIALRSAADLGGAKEPIPDGPALDRVLDRVHIEIGAECHQEWNLPQYLTVIAVRHHDREIPADAEFADLHAVRLASALLDLRGETLAPRAAAEVAQSARALALSPFAVRTLDAELRDASQRVSSAFGVDGRSG